jgi:hypothetical protein
MPHKKHLNETLRAAHDELYLTQHLDEDTRRLLRVLLGDIHHALDSNASQPAQAPQSLEAAALSFEERHPRLTEALRALAQGLRQAGV